jgi:Mannosyltransferase (PIG-V)
MTHVDRPRLPSWVRILDLLAIAAFIVTLAVVLFGGGYLRLGFVRLSARSPLRLAFITLAIIAVRHAAFPSPPLHRRALEWARFLRDDPAASVVTTAWVSRVAVLVTAYFAVLTIGLNKEVGFKVSADPLMNLPARYDAGWYASIAMGGYYFQGRYDRQQNIVFFPAYPLAMRVVGYLVGGFERGVFWERRMARALWGGAILSILLFMWGASYLARLARDTIGEAHATDAVLLTAAYPFAIFFSLPYTEALFLLGSVAAFYHFRRHEWVRAATWGALVGLTRPNGCLLSVALACLIVEQWFAARAAEHSPHQSQPKQLLNRQLPNHQILKAFAAASTPGLGMLAYSAYVHHLTGAWFGWAHLQVAWGRSFEGLAPLGRALARIGDEGLARAVVVVPYDTLNGLAWIFALVMLWPVVRRLGFGAAVFVVINVIPPVFAGGLLSMGRITSTLFPTFIALAAILPRRFVLPLVTAFAIGQGVVAAIFFTWRPLY